MLNVIILAGENCTTGFNGKSDKALTCIRGKAMVEYVIEAFKKLECISNIVVVGKINRLKEPLEGKVSGIVEMGETIMDNILAGVNYLGEQNPVIISSCDIPLVTAEALEDFIGQAKAINADLCYPIVEKSLNYTRYPQFERTYVKLKEGTFTGGNIFYLNPAIVRRGYSLANKLLEARKNPVKMAAILSPGFLFRLAMGKLEIGKIEEKVSNMLDINAKAIISSYPEIGNDIDKPSDISAAENYLKN